jgi:hypothetical protein
MISRRGVFATITVFLLIAGSACDLPGESLCRKCGSRRVRGLAPCEVPHDLLQRVSRGYVPGRSGDVLTIEWSPNQYAGVRHSTPFAYTQNVPVVLYGPGFVRAGVKPGNRATVADLAPTFAELMGFDEYPYENREGRVLEEALLPKEERNGVPRLLVTVVWDGGGDNLLAQWPNSWPELDRIAEFGATFRNATVGSSPSITPSIHSNIGTGTFPTTHGITDMKMLVDGEMVFPFSGLSADSMFVDTLGDLWDLAKGNVPHVGMLAPYSYHLGMLGHGAQLLGADHDIAVFNEHDGVDFRTNPRYYELPEYLRSPRGLDDAIAEVDKRDGEADLEWRGVQLEGDDPLLLRTPVWPINQTLRIEELLSREGFGQDETPDLFYTNYKTIDLAGHTWNLVEPEVREALEESDRQLAELVEFLDEHVGSDRYVLALTADHGISPYPRITGGWPISGDEITKDIDARFGTNGESILLSNRGYQSFLNDQALDAAGVTAADIAAFLRNYRIRDNASGGVPAAFANKADERVFLTALTPSELRRALKCTRKKSR